MNVRILAGTVLALAVAGSAAYFFAADTRFGGRLPGSSNGRKTSLTRRILATPAPLL